MYSYVPVGESCETAADGAPIVRRGFGSRPAHIQHELDSVLEALEQQRADMPGDRSLALVALEVWTLADIHEALGAEAASTIGKL